MRRAEKAKELFENGYACSQAVALAFADAVGLDEKELAKITLPFGGGLGRLRLTCGAVSGMAAIYGLLFAGEENTSENKLATYAGVRWLCEKFEAQLGTLICAELLEGNILKKQEDGCAPEYYKKCSCGEIVYIAASILEEYAKEKGKL